MTVLFFSRLFYPHIGGVETYVLALSQALRKRGHRIIVVTELSERKSKEKDTYEGIEIHRIANLKDNWFKKFFIWSWLWKNRTLLEKADVIHCHDVFFWYVPFLVVFLQKPVYTTFHGYEGEFPPSKRAILVRRVSEMLSFGTICTGEFIKKWYGTKPAFIIYGGVEKQEKEDRKQGIKKKQKRLNILLVGRLEEDIGIKTYLEVLAALKGKKIPFTLEILGDGPFRKEVEQLGKVHGFVSDISSYLARATVVFASSYLTILESFAHEKLVVGVYENALKKDYLMMTPFAKYMLVGNDPVELASELAQTRRNTALAKKAYLWVSGQTWERVADTYLKLWHR
jgi:glycosyltransferase involved in cell wall biosynthesis